MDQQSVKNRFAQALRSLIKERSLRDITVGAISQEAGLSRKTFYNNFHDKFELLAWMLNDEFVQKEEQSLKVGGWEAFKSFLGFFSQNRTFYADALADMSQNSLGQYFSDLLFDVIYGTLSDGFMATSLSEHEAKLCVEALTEMGRQSTIIYLRNPDAFADEDAFMNFLLRANDAFTAMVCSYRSELEGSPQCDFVKNTLGGAWTLENAADRITLTDPQAPSQLRADVEREMSR